jgi:hypothetical protein
MIRGTLSPRTLRSLDSTARATLQLTDSMLWGSAPEIGSGGGTWTVTRQDTSGGGGVMGPAGEPSTHEITETYILRQGDPRLQSTPLGTQIADSDWYLLAPLGTDIEAGDLLESVDVPGIAFRVTGLSISLSEARYEGTVDEVSTVLYEAPEEEPEP